MIIQKHGTIVCTIKPDSSVHTLISDFTIDGTLQELFDYAHTYQHALEQLQVGRASLPAVCPPSAPRYGAIIDNINLCN